MHDMRIINTVLLTAIPALLFGETGYYRLSWRSDPATSAVICWNQVSGAGPEVCYDTVDHGKKAIAYRFRQLPDRVEAYRGMNNHFVRLENLEPDTAYYFVICDSEGVSRRLWFRTAPAEPQPFTFIAGGDSRTNREPRREGNKLVARLRPLFVLFGGDYSGEGNAEQWAEWFEDWQLTISEDGRIYPLIATHGNHENADLQMVGKLFDTPHPDQYFALNVGGDMMRIWVLNSELEYKAPGRIAEQNAWIESDLPKYPDVQWKIATYHRPMRAHTAHKQEGINRIAWWAELFHANGVDLVIESDTHMVKQTYPIRPSSEEGSYESFIRDDKTGTVFIGEGSWGAPKRPANDDKPWTMASDSFYQFKWIQARPEEMLIRTVRFDGADTVAALTDSNRFDEPEGMVFWEPESGKVLRLPFNAGHPSYTEPLPSRTLLHTGEVWAWSTDGTNWIDGAAPLGYGNDLIRTVIGRDNTKPSCAFFSKEFHVEDPSRVTRLFFDVQADDGCIVLLNGEEVIRYNMPEGQIDNESRALSRMEGWTERKTIPLPVDPVYLQPGINTLDVRVHQVSPDSSGLMFDLGVRVKDQ
jgi:hypothetical protein